MMDGFCRLDGGFQSFGGQSHRLAGTHDQGGSDGTCQADHGTHAL